MDAIVYLCFELSFIIHRSCWLIAFQCQVESATLAKMCRQYQPTFTTRTCMTLAVRIYRYDESLSAKTKIIEGMNDFCFFRDPIIHLPCPFCLEISNKRRRAANFWIWPLDCYLDILTVLLLFSLEKYVLIFFHYY